MGVGRWRTVAIAQPHHLDRTMPARTYTPDERQATSSPRWQNQGDQRRNGDLASREVRFINGSAVTYMR